MKYLIIIVNKKDLNNNEIFKINGKNIFKYLENEDKNKTF